MLIKIYTFPFNQTEQLLVDRLACRVQKEIEYNQKVICAKFSFLMLVHFSVRKARCCIHANTLLELKIRSGLFRITKLCL
jgi:hypothetical protein